MNYDSDDSSVDYGEEDSHDAPNKKKVAAWGENKKSYYADRDGGSSSGGDENVDSSEAEEDQLHEANRL